MKLKFGTSYNRIVLGGLAMINYVNRGHIIYISIIILFCSTVYAHSSITRRQNTIESSPHHNNTITVSPVISPTIISSFFPPWNIDYLVKDVPKMLENASSYSISFLKNHQWKILSASLIGGYISLYIYLIFSNHYLNRTSLWGAWNAEWSTETMQMNQHALINEILARYICSKKPTDSIFSLMEFLKAIDQEISFLQHYITTASIITTIPKAFLLPCNKEKLMQAHYLLQRTVTIKHIFFNWLVGHNLNNFN